MSETKSRQLPCGFARYSTLIVALAVAIGCSKSSSKPTAKLSGTVTINGQSLPENAEGTIMFRPASPGMANTAGVPIVDGKYDSPATPVGDVTVFFSIQTPTGKMLSDAGGPPFPELQSIVPASAAKGVKLTVTEDAAKDFNLE